MSNWYAYRWVCVDCGAIHYFRVDYCRKCRKTDIEKVVNNARAVARQQAAQQKQQTKTTQDEFEDSEILELLEGDDDL